MSIGSIVNGGDKIELSSGSFTVYYNADPNGEDSVALYGNGEVTVRNGTWKIKNLDPMPAMDQGGGKIYLCTYPELVPAQTQETAASVTTVTANSTCDHDYKWETEIEPTDTKEGEEVLKCTKCQSVKMREPLSSYAHFIGSSTYKIKKAESGDTIVISSKIWNSYPKSLFEAVAAKNEITVDMQFPDDKHIMHELTVTSEQAKSMNEAYYGYAKMISMGAQVLSR